MTQCPWPEGSWEEKNFHDREKKFKELREERLKEEKLNVNVMEVLGVETSEKPHTSFLAWLLKPEASHGLGEEFLEKFLEKVSEKTKRKIDRKLYKNVIVELEKPKGEENEKKDFPDIVIKNEGFLCLIENKVKSGEGKDQTTRYFQKIEEEYPLAKKFFVYLTVNGDDPKCDKFVSFTYSEIRDILNSLDCKHSTDGACCLICDYIRNLETNVLNKFGGFSKSSVLSREYWKDKNWCLKRSEPEFKDLAKEYERDFEIVDAKLNKDFEKLFMSLENKFHEDIDYDPKEWKSLRRHHQDFIIYKTKWISDIDKSNPDIFYRISPTTKNDEVAGLVIWLLFESSSAGNPEYDYRKKLLEEFQNSPMIKECIKNNREHPDDPYIKFPEDEEWQQRKVVVKLDYLGIEYNDNVSFDEGVYAELIDFEKKFRKPIDDIYQKYYDN